MSDARAGADPMANLIADELDDLAHWTRRMLQALDAYWLHYDGYSGNGHPRCEGAEERWWNRFERYRARVEASIGQATKGPTLAGGAERPYTRD